MDFNQNNPLKIGTRGSPLALAQAVETRTRLMTSLSLNKNAFEIIAFKTTGDRILDRPLGEIGGKGLFTKEIEEALLNKTIDIAVHSMKDMPVELPQGLILNCYLPREDVRDAFISLHYKKLSDLPIGSIIGSSSLRRRAQIAAIRPDIKLVEFRGNVQTRLKKLDDGIADATFLAMAGLNRLKKSKIAYPISVKEMLPAIAQGCIGIERHIDNLKASKALASIHDTNTELRINAERALLAGLDGSCQTPIAGLATLNNNRLTLYGEVLRPDGSETITHMLEGDVSDGIKIGIEMAMVLKSQMGHNFFD